MSLITTDLFGSTTDKVKTAIDRIRAFEPGEGYYLSFSGGKDSVVIKALAEMAGVQFDAHYSVTTVDPPELVHFIRDNHPDVIFERPKYSMRQLIIIKFMMPPTHFARYCCAELKETKGEGRVVMTGTRWAESFKRRDNQGLVTIMNGRNGMKTAELTGADYKTTQRGGIIMNTDNDPARRTVELCYRTNKTLVNPIVDWSDEDVWEFIHSYNIPYCSLYDDGFNRLGCIGCPLTNIKQRLKEFERWPYMYKMYLHAFADMLEARRQTGRENTSWTCAEDVMQWWLYGSNNSKPIDGQISFDEHDDR